MGAHRYAARRLQAAQLPDHLRGIRRGRGSQHQAALLLTTPQGRSSGPTRATASRSIYGWTWSRRRRCSTTGWASGRPGQHTLTIPRDEGTGQRVPMGAVEFFELAKRATTVEAIGAFYPHSATVASAGQSPWESCRMSRPSGAYRYRCRNPLRSDDQMNSPVASTTRRS